MSHRMDRITGFSQDRVTTSDGAPTMPVGRVTYVDNLMDFCNKCGKGIEADWVFCRSCGYSLGDRELDAISARQGTPVAAAPKVELISRGWDVVDVEAIDVDTVDVDMIHPLDDDVVAPLAPGTIEITIDDLTVIEHSEEEAENDSEEEIAVGAVPPVARDAWDHLRPHGQMPATSEPSRIRARVGQALVMVAAFAALVSSALYLVLNVQLERFAEGEVSAGTVIDFRHIAEVSLLVLAGLSAIALMSLVWWMLETVPLSRFGPGPAGMVALPAFLGGTALVAIFALEDSATVADSLTANSLVVLGLGLLMVSGLATIRIVRRVEIGTRW